MTATLDLSPILKSPRLPDITATLVNRLRDETERRERFYDEMSEDDKVEFINGEFIAQLPSRNCELCAKQNMATLLNTFAQVHRLGEVRDGQCLCVFPRNDYEPDIVFFSKEKSNQFTDDQMLFPAPDFVVEILSPSTEKYDRNEKFVDYAAHGVQEYWIIEPEIEIVEQYFNEGGKFVLFQKLHKGLLESKTVSGFAIDLKDIFH